MHKTLHDKEALDLLSQPSFLPTPVMFPTVAEASHLGGKKYMPLK